MEHLQVSCRCVAARQSVCVPCFEALNAGKHWMANTCICMFGGYPTHAARGVCHGTMMWHLVVQVLFNNVG